VALVEKPGFRWLPFLKPRPRPDEDERLMQLFRNRADLKKVHTALQDEVYELKERIKQQETSHTRTQEQLDNLEGLLGTADAGFNALVFFQLRALWRACHHQLEVFGAELERQQEERERKKQMFEFNQAQRVRLDAIDARLAAAERMVEESQAGRAELEQRLAKLKGFWNYFKRRRVQHQLTQSQAPLAQSQRAVQEIRDEHAAKSAEQCEPFPGISVEGRRAINLATIAYALVLGVKLSTHGLATRARECMQKRVQEASYGSRDDCDALMVAIAQALDAVKQRKDVAGDIKVCVELLREHSQYRSPGDTIPLADSLGAVIPPNTSGKAMLALSAPQVLADDYWNIYRVLLR
jgi:septal ring factor EnvC (AmiA/AmiB activator)